VKVQRLFRPFSHNLLRGPLRPLIIRGLRMRGGAMSDGPAEGLIGMAADQAPATKLLVGNKPRMGFFVARYE